MPNWENFQNRGLRCLAITKISNAKGVSLKDKMEFARHRSATTHSGYIRSASMEDDVAFQESLADKPRPSKNAVRKARKKASASKKVTVSLPLRRTPSARIKAMKKKKEALEDI